MKRITFYMLISLLCVVSVVRGDIKVGDNLQIIIKGVPTGERGKIDGPYVVGKSGSIRLPIADQAVQAAGLSAEALARRIEKVYRDAQIYTTPTIEVITNAVPSSTGATISIGGQVKRPGPVSFQPGMTLLQAVQAAGDLTPFGTKKKVDLIRGEQRFRLDLRKPKDQQRELRLNDTIIIRQKGPFDQQ